MTKINSEIQPTSSNRRCEFTFNIFAHNIFSLLAIQVSVFQQAIFDTIINCLNKNCSTTDFNTNKQPYFMLYHSNSSPIKSK